MDTKHTSMLIKLTRAFTLAMSFSIFLTGCFKFEIVSPTTVTPTDTSETSVEQGRSLDPILASIGIIEDLSFEVNRSASATIEYDGTEALVLVVDEKGLTWQLDIPENALPGNCSITLTPLADIKGENKKDGLSGILMEPDGLVFTKPATLAVTGTDTDKLLFLTGTQNGKNYTYQPSEKLENGIKLPVNHFSSTVASDIFGDPEAYKALKETLPDLERSVKDILSKTIKVPDFMEIPLECYKEIPAVAIQQIEELLLPDYKNALWAGILMKFCEQQGDKIGVNKARRQWLDSIRNFL